METTLNSKLIDAIAYDEKTQRLRIFMSNGQRREYQDVPASVVRKLAAARSPGHFYSNEIRGKYRSL
ncbi:KTSC domain-containing protein [Rhizobium sp. P32RR-XVIII]|nr:KTSC domain-containing protein [Rhizobium sp. P32RR-XVIII]